MPVMFCSGSMPVMFLMMRIVFDDAHLLRLYAGHVFDELGHGRHAGSSSHQEHFGQGRTGAWLDDG